MQTLRDHALAHIIVLDYLLIMLVLAVAKNDAMEPRRVAETMPAIVVAVWQNEVVLHVVCHYNRGLEREISFLSRIRTHTVCGKQHLPAALLKMLDWRSCWEHSRQRILDETRYLSAS